MGTGIVFLKFGISNGSRQGQATETSKMLLLFSAIGNKRQAAGDGDGGILLLFPRDCKPQAVTDDDDQNHDFFCIWQQAVGIKQR